MIRHYYEVSFPLAMPRDALTYHLDQPPEEPSLPLGCRVIAPIQRRHTIGYIVGTSDQKPEFTTVPIQEIVDLWPLLPPPMIALGTWIAQTCFCSPGEAFHAMLPSGIKQRIIRSVRATAAARAKKLAGDDLPNAVLWLIDQEEMVVAKFLDLFPGFSRKMSAFLDQGLLEIVHTRSEAAKPKVVRFLSITPDRELQIGKLTPKERLVVEFLLKVNTPTPPAAVQKVTGVSSSPIEQLLKKGIITLSVDRVFRQVATAPYYLGEPAPIPILTAEQAAALQEISRENHDLGKPILIRGVTCSGKTEIYLRWVADQIALGKGVIVLVPEISLTPQMTKRFRDRFGNHVAILHSKLSDGERFDQWEQIRRGECPVVVGARSAVFAPVKNLGSIIIDEEGEPSFKQGESPRYHAREVAIKRCELENARLIMGSATPTMDSYQKALTGTFRLVELANRVTNRLPPLITVVDMRQELVTKKNRSMFSQEMGNAIRAALQNKKQIILYLNRRGHSSFVFCRACGEAVECSRCKVSLVYHNSSRILRCHYCGEARDIPTVCPKCSSQAIKFFGAGVQRIEEEARRYFPEARIQRLDSDTVATSGSLEDILDRFGRYELDVLIGTQMVAKGLDFPNVTLVGIMAADGLLRLPDFRASERNFSLLAQVAGRAGRGDSPGRVVLQTYFPEHHSIQHALTENYLGFFNEESALRRETGFPPFSQVIMILLASENLDKVKSISKALTESLQPLLATPGNCILGPSPAPIEKMNNQFRFQILLKFSNRGETSLFIKNLMTSFSPSGVRVTIDPDPYFSL